MTGQKQSSKTLNNTLQYIAKLLNHNDILWFISYGTLLGIVRDNSCIENDDDVDIIVEKSMYDKLLSLLIENKFEIEKGYNIKNSKNIIKTKPTKEYSSIDFYICVKNDKNDFQDVWNNVTWTDCYENNKLIKKPWKDTNLYLPNNYINKLEKRYGNWKVPSKSKGNITLKKI